MFFQSYAVWPHMTMRQKVAYGLRMKRAAPNPDILLLDEPLPNLDANLRGDMRFEIRRPHDAFHSTSICVTHDQVQKDAPKGYADLPDPKWKGKLAKAHPGYSGTALTGTYAISKALGWDYLAKLSKQGVQQLQSTTATPKSIASGERAPLRQIKLLPDDPAGMLPATGDIKKRYTGPFGN